MKRITVLITGAGTATCQSILKGLRSQDEFQVEVLTADMQDSNAGRWFSDRFFRIPPARGDAFLPTMLDICRQQHVELLIPVVDYEFESLARARPQFEQFGCRVAISEPDVIRTCGDKWQTFEFFRREGFPTPPTWLPVQLEETPLPYPLYVKPRLLGRGSIDTYRVNEPDQLFSYIRALPNSIVQKAIQGREFTVDVLCDFSGRALNGVVRERIETKAGVSSKGRTVRDTEILDGAVAVAERLPIQGPANIQCFRSEDGVYFLEVNPRYSGALVLSIAAGFNSPLWLLKLARGEVLPRALGSYRENVTMFRYWQEVFVDDSARRLPALKME